MITAAITALALTIGATGTPVASAPPQQVHSSVQLVAAAWCAARSDSGSQAGAPGCDAGLGVALQNWGRLAFVAAVGTKTVGLGLAWVAGEFNGKPVAVSVGVVAPHSSGGIDVGERALALGATFGFK